MLKGSNMKIGRFAAENGITIDAVRHYMELGLLLPEKRGGQYEFDEGCQIDFNEVSSLKDMGFSLKEIKEYFVYKKLGHLQKSSENSFYNGFYSRKLKDITSQIEKLRSIERMLGEKLDQISETGLEARPVSGLDIDWLKHLCCCRCKGSLRLADGYIQDNGIIDGRLKCSCGESYSIVDGILVSGMGETVEKPSDQADEASYECMIDAYIKATDKQYIDKIYTGLEWAHRKLDYKALEGKVLLELGSGIGFFLRHIYDDLPSGALYIAVDYDIKKHRFLKAILDQAPERKNILYVCADFNELPLKEKSVDVVVDFSGTSNYSFEHEDMLLRLIDRYVRDNAWLLGSYILFKNFLSGNPIPVDYRKNFRLENIKNEISRLGYKLESDALSEPVEKGGVYENYFSEGEKVFTYGYFGRKQG